MGIARTSQPSGRHRDEQGMAGRLPPRQRAVATVLALGRSDKEIAAALGVKVSTVKTHLRRLFRKLRVRSRLELAVALAGRLEPPS